MRNTSAIQGSTLAICGPSKLPFTLTLPHTVVSPRWLISRRIRGSFGEIEGVGTGYCVFFTCALVFKYVFCLFTEIVFEELQSRMMS